MSNKSNLRFLVVLLFAAFAVAALVTADIGVLAQNANSSGTEESAQNANMTPHRGRRRHRRARRRAAAAADAAATEAATTGASQTGDVTGEQTDLSGTYTGHVKMSGGWDVDGDGTLTITGNTFQLESGGTTHGGRVYAVTTRGYTGAAFYFTDLTDPTTNTAVVANVRARKSGDRLWLMPVPGTSTKLWFGSGGRGMGAGGGGHHRRGRRGRRHAAPAANANTGDSATPPM